jgi:hypothetical protein
MAKASSVRPLADGIRQQLREDPQLLAIHDLFNHPSIVRAATNHEVVWGHVKGYPWWPVRCPFPTSLSRWARLGLLWTGDMRASFLCVAL